MGKLDACSRCPRFCKGHCTGQFVFRICTLSILVIATILQVIAVSPKTKWDTFETVLRNKKVLPEDVEISAYQTLYDVFVSKDIPSKYRSGVPVVYPIKKGEFEIDWKDAVSYYETTSQGLGIGAIMVLENALLIHFLIPESYFSKFFQPLALVVTVLMCGASSALSILGALNYSENYQKVFYANSGPPRIKSQVKQLYRFGFSYNLDDNELSTGYLLAIAAGSMFALCGALCIAVLVEYIITRCKIWKKSKTIDCDKRAILPHNEKSPKGEIKNKKGISKNKSDRIIIEDVEDIDIKGKTNKTSSNGKEKDTTIEKTKK